MFSLIWIVLAIIATARGARWKPWIAVGIGLASSYVLGMALGSYVEATNVPTYVIEDAAIFFGAAIEVGLTIVTGYYAIKPHPSHVG